MTSPRSPAFPSPWVVRAASARGRSGRTLVGLALAALLALAASGTTVAAAPGVRVEQNVSYAGPLRLDAFLPNRSGPAAGILVVHRGGWSAGSRQSVDAFAARLAALGWDAFALDYRLAPRHRFPAALDDLRRALRWLATHARRFRLDPSRLGLLGFSAGGNLALEAALAADATAAGRAVRVAAVAAWSAPTDLARFVRESRSAYALRSIAAYLGCPLSACPGRYRAASPVFLLGRRSPPLFLANASRELVPFAQARELAERAQRDGVPVSLLVVSSSRHAAAYAKIAWMPTLAFFRRYLRSDRRRRRSA